MQKDKMGNVTLSKTEYKAVQRLLRRMTEVIVASTSAEDTVGWDHYDALLILDDLFQGKVVGKLEDYIHDETPGVKTVEQWLRKYGAKR